MKNSKVLRLFSFVKIENFLAYSALFLLALFPFMEVIARKFFHTGIANTTLYTHHLVLIISFIGGMITSREGKHLALSLKFDFSKGHQELIHKFVASLSAVITTALAWSSFSFVLNGFAPGQKIGPVSIKLVVLVMVFGFVVMTVRFFVATPTSGEGGEEAKRHQIDKMYLLLSFITGTIIALEPLLNILYAFFTNLPPFMESIPQLIQSVNAFIALPIIILLIIAAVFGAPIFVVLGGIAFMLFARVGEPLEVIPNEAYSMLISHSIPAIPLFTVAGFILSESKAGERLVNLFRALFSWFPGGLAIMAILVSGFFTTFTGASGVTILALGALLSYVLLKGKYGKKFSLGLLTASGSIGLLFPPSLPIIIYGVTAQVSIKDMFIGGIIPGIVMVSALVIFGIWYALKNNVQKEPFRLLTALKAFKEAIWEVLLPVIILLSYFGGLTTLVESSAIAVIYALIVEIFINRDLKFSDLPGVFYKCIPIIGGVLIILAMAKGLSYFIVDAEIPMKLTEWVQANISSKYVFLFLLNIALLITGCFMDIFSAIMVVVPLILPLGTLFGIHPVHLGIIFLANMELGYLTPPVGLNLFLASYRFNEPLNKIYKEVIPFFIIQLITVLLITYIPFFSTFLLNLTK